MIVVDRVQIQTKSFEYSTHNGRVFSPSCGYGPGCILWPNWRNPISLKLHSSPLGVPKCLLCFFFLILFGFSMFGGLFQTLKLVKMAFPILGEMFLAYFCLLSECTSIS